ncbi:MAG: hypothetical protein KatS3mg077_0467 [Candidatus Binatia bacterium]|nr:MAG: hypothetical protein KatS3mg077_0467 [Candidatus Binatia bacterium]
MTFELAEQVWRAIRAHAEETYPEECCGLVVVREGSPRVVRVRNVQNELHARDPEAFPRTAKTAYSMDYEEVAPLLEDAYRGAIRILAFYHSHPDHDAYFSAEDRAAAEGWLDDPNYAAAVQLVVSVREGKVVDVKAYAWSPQQRDYEPVALQIAGA